MMVLFLIINYGHRLTYVTIPEFPSGLFPVWRFDAPGAKGAPLVHQLAYAYAEHECPLIYSLPVEFEFAIPLFIQNCNVLSRRCNVNIQSGTKYRIVKQRNGLWACRNRNGSNNRSGF